MNRQIVDPRADIQCGDLDWRPALRIHRRRPNLARLRILMLDDTVLSLKSLSIFDSI